MLIGGAVVYAAVVINIVASAAAAVISLLPGNLKFDSQVGASTREATLVAAKIWVGIK